jgi:hypothetical protein
MRGCDHRADDRTRDRGQRSREKLGYGLSAVGIAEVAIVGLLFHSTWVFIGFAVLITGLFTLSYDALAPTHRAATLLAYVIAAGGCVLVAFAGLLPASGYATAVGLVAICIAPTLIGSEAPEHPSGWLLLVVRGIPVPIIITGELFLLAGVVSRHLLNVYYPIGIAVVAIGCGLIAIDFAGVGRLAERSGLFDDPMTRRDIALWVMKSVLIAIGLKIARHVITLIAPLLKSLIAPFLK